MRLPNRTTVRELLAFISIIALAIASTRFPAPFVWSLIVFGWLVIMAIFVAALVGRGRFRIFAIGFAVPVLCYTAALLYIGRSEIFGQSSVLPTTLFFHLVLLPSYEHAAWQIPKWHMLFAMVSGYACGRFALWAAREPVRDHIQ